MVCAAIMEKTMNGKTKRNASDPAADDDLSSQSLSASTVVDVDDLIREYKAYAKKSSEDVLQLASTTLKADALDSRSERERFYAEVKLDPKGATARKLRVIAGALPRFQPFLAIMPNTWTTIYELSKMSDEEFKTVVESGVLHPFVTMVEIDEARGRASTKPKQQFILNVDLYKIGTPTRQAEFARRLEALVEEFGIKWEPMAPEREKVLSRILTEADEQKQAA